MMACDPLKSGVVGWLSGELARDQATHEVHEARMVPSSWFDFQGAAK
jgi:hypothetical protein